MKSIFIGQTCSFASRLVNLQTIDDGDREDARLFGTLCAMSMSDRKTELTPIFRNSFKQVYRQILWPIPFCYAAVLR